MVYASAPPTSCEATQVEAVEYSEVLRVICASGVLRKESLKGVLEAGFEVAMLQRDGAYAYHQVVGYRPDYVLVDTTPIQ